MPNAKPGKTDTRYGIAKSVLASLKGKLAGCWAVTVQANWRVVFRFEDGDASVVDYLDYH